MRWLKKDSLILPRYKTPIKFFEIYKTIQISLLCIRSRQKEFSLYIEEAKQEKTKHSRLEKIIPLILKGVGLNDKYKK